MTSKSGKMPRRHRLLIYRRLSQRWRVAPFLTALLGVVLYALGWLTSRAILQGGNVVLLNSLWENRVLVIGLIGLSIALYLLIVLMGRLSYVEARPKALRVRAGLIPVDLSYGRIRQIRLTQVATLYPPESLKGRDRALLQPFVAYSATAVDMQSWPKVPIKRRWHKFMFTPDKTSLLFIIEDAMLLNQQIDSAIAARHARRSGQARAYKDPIERAAEAQRRAKQGRR